MRASFAATFIATASAALVSTPFGDVPTECVVPISAKPVHPPHCGAALLAAMDKLHEDHQRMSQVLPFARSYYTYTHAISNTTFPGGFANSGALFHLPFNMSAVSNTFRLLVGTQSEPWVPGVTPAPTGTYQFIISASEWNVARGGWDAEVYIADLNGLLSAKDFSGYAQGQTFEGYVVANVTKPRVELMTRVGGKIETVFTQPFELKMPLTNVVVSTGGAGGGCSQVPIQPVPVQHVSQHYSNGVHAVPFWQIAVDPRHPCHEHIVQETPIDLTFHYQ